MLLDPETFDLVQHIDTFLAAVAGHELEAQMKAELMQSVLEIATPVCDTPAEVDRRAAEAREYVTSVARRSRCASARQARIRSACSKSQRSQPATGTARSSTRCSTWRAAS